MAHRGETLHKDVCCIADLKKMGSSRLAPMVRGECQQFPTTIHCASADLDRLLQWRSYGSNHVWNIKLQRLVHLPNIYLVSTRTKQPTIATRSVPGS